ncbi:Rap1a/Tai family immunity protein [Pseudomonas nitroreducens]|uniref:Rap1a/Tai family immunity protein n=1 Tax=Pseudomonas nitroreducens TaxID=46680 RepID=UPI003CC825DB
MNMNELAGGLNGKFLLVLGGVLLLLQTVTSQAKEADYADGNLLLRDCNEVVAFVDKKPVGDTFGMGRCIGILEGTTGALTLVEDSVPKNLKTCYPTNYTNGQGARIVVKFLNDHPENLDLPAAFVAAMGLRLAFPCR